MFHNNILFKTFIILLMLASCSAFAGDKIKLKLIQPPPNKMPVASFWKMDIENTTRENITIYLEGTASGEKLGLIVDGKSNTFSVKPGKSTYGYVDFKSGEVSWKNKSIQEIIFRTGEVPADVYTICVTAFYENGQVADKQICITHPIERPTEGMITLINPADGEEVNSETGINFVWTGTGLKGPYTLQIVQIKSGQSNEQAFNENRVLFEKNDLTLTSFRYPIEAPKLEADKKYVWRIKTSNIISLSHSFKNIMSKENPQNCIAKKVNEQWVKVADILSQYVSCNNTLLHYNDGDLYLCLYPNCPNYVESDIRSGNWCNYFELRECDPLFPYQYPINFRRVGCKSPISGLTIWYPFDENDPNNGFSEDMTINQIPGYWMGDLEPYCDGMVYYGVKFNGNNYITADNYPENNFGLKKNFSISLWFKLDEISSGFIPNDTLVKESRVLPTGPTYGDLTILDKRTVSNGKYKGYHLIYFHSMKKFVLQLADGTGSKGFLNYISNSVNDLGTVWHQLTVVVYRSSSTGFVMWYVDGQFNKSQLNVKTGDLTNSAPLNIGVRYDKTTGFFKGVMDEFQIYNKALSVPEIKKIYQAKPFGFCVPE